MNTKRLSKSVRKFIRSEKARLRKTVASAVEQEKSVLDLIKRFH